MLETLRIQNFKSWQDTGDIRFGSLTGFFGTNSSGKSSILQFLLMLKQTVESSDRSQVLNLGDEFSYVELGTMHDILHQHKDPASLSFFIQWTDQIPKIEWSENFFCQIDYSNSNISLHNFRYERHSKNPKQKFWSSSMVRESNVNKPTYTLVSKTSNKESRTLNIQKPSKFYIFPNEAYIIPRYDDLLNIVVFRLEDYFDSIHYLGPLREYPSRLYLWGGEQPEDVGTRGERAVAALLASRNQEPTIDMGPDQPKRTVEEHVAHWLKELGMIHSFVVQPIAPNRKEYEVRIQRTAESASVFLTDVGFGVSQILPVLVLLFYVPEGSTVILEQPEIHLHPAVQAGLADVFVDAIKRRRLQIILESHSEHLLQRLQRRMAEFGVNKEKGFDSDKAALYFTDIEKGRSKLTPLALDDYGNISNWPEGFFGDPFADAAAMLDAEMKRRQAPSA